MKKLIEYRAEFDSVQNCHYLISNSLGAMPNRAHEAASRYLKIWQERGVRSWEEEWWMLARNVGDRIGAVIGAPPDTVSMHPNVTSSQATILSCLDITAKRNKVVMVDMEFPSIQYFYRQSFKDQGEIEIIKSRDGISIPLDELLSAIDERTALVPISHTLFRSSYIVDAQAIIEKAHKVGALVVLDIFQSVGVIPVDVTKLGADFVVGGMLKWMCGGPGACFLYVRPDLAGTLKPRFTGWLAHESPFEFDISEMRYASGSYRFQSGTPVIPALYSCQGGLDIITEIGVDRIRRRSIEMTTKIIELADQRGWRITAPRESDTRGGTVAIDIENGYAICQELCARDFLVDYRPQSGIRISAHFYNTDQELLELFEMVDEIINSGSFKHHSESAKVEN